MLLNLKKLHFITSIFVLEIEVNQLHLKLGPGIYGISTPTFFFLFEYFEIHLFAQLFYRNCSSKIFAIANAGGHLRTNESSCVPNSVGVGGGVVSGKHGANSTPLGDLATVICSYDTTAGYTSNSLSSYFHDFGWRDRINQVVLQDWLHVPQGQTLGGNYGEATPSDLSFTVSDQSRVCSADKDPWPKIYPNSISALTAVELTRRLVHHRESEESFRFPGLRWRDVQDILYGAESSALFPGQLWGGMTSDTAVFLQSSNTLKELLVNNEEVLQQGQWRIFSKLGAGYSTSRYVGEIVTNAHVCLPAYNEDGKTIGGLELTLTGRGSIPQDSSLNTVDARLQAAVNAAVAFAQQFNEQSSS